jgi:hypothetical protein
METESDVQVGLRDAELESLLLRVGERFGRVEPRRRMRDYVRGLLGPVGRKTAGTATTRCMPPRCRRSPGSRGVGV